MAQNVMVDRIIEGGQIEVCDKLIAVGKCGFNPFRKFPVTPLPLDVEKLRRLTRI